jgi:S-adenosyl-L-methionine hydrolase (adenosine-forming)
VLKKIPTIGTSKILLILDKIDSFFFKLSYHLIMRIITLTTDFQRNDYYIGATKGAILSLCNNATIVDITHEVPLFDTVRAAYLVKNAYSNFPEGTIHIIGVMSEATLAAAHLVVKFDGHYFIGADTGLFSLIFGDEKPDEIIELNVSLDSNRLSFPTKDIFAKVACHIINGVTISALGRKIDNVTRQIGYQPFIDQEVLRGMVVHIDSYGNAITNISDVIFNNFVKNDSFTIFYRTMSSGINRVSYTYSDVPEGEPLALFNSTNFLEIALHKGKASGLLGIQLNSHIRVVINDH